jgi:two-component system LytT family response regulator
MKVIIIDDEEKLTESLQIMLEKINENVQCVGTAHNALDGIKLINSLKPQLVFLDINMPQHSGFEMLDLIGEKKFIVVFTTAHDEFAIQAIKHKAFDYLLKPIDMEELKACVQKVKIEIESKQNTKSLHIQVNVKEGVLLLKPEEIVHIEASGSYSVIYGTDGKKHTVTKNLKAMEEILDPVLFFRCHNSHIVNLQHIKKIIKTEGFYLEMDNKAVIEVSRNKKEELMSRL